MIQDRTLIHLNIADFAAGVETCLTPSLKQTPLIIAPQGAPRARVFDMNEPAFQEGIRKGMPLARARQLHPKIPVLPPRFRQYTLVMKDIFKQAAAFTPSIESGDADGHFFLDITGTSRLHGPPPDVAWRLRNAMRRRTGLDPIWTLATSKLVAKAASRVVKPRGEIIVGPGEEEAFLAPLPLTLLPGLTPEECRQLARLNICSVSQARRLTRNQLALVFDCRAGHIHDLLMGIDKSPVKMTPGTPPPGRGRRAAAPCPLSRDKIRAVHEFSTDTNQAHTLKAGLALITARICRDLRRQRCRAGIMQIQLTYSDTLFSSRRRAMDTDSDTEMLKQAWDLLLAAWTRRTRIRHLAVTCSPRPPSPTQALLFAPPAAGPARSLAGALNAPAATARSGQLYQAVDRVRARFGTLAVQSGAALGLGPLESGRDQGFPACS